MLQLCMNDIWNKLCPESVSDFLVFETLSTVAEDVIDDVNELLQSNGESLQRRT